MFCRIDQLGLEVVGQRVERKRAVLACRVVERDDWCRRGGCQGTARDTVVRRLAHEPLGWRPTSLEVTVRRYRCSGCRHVWRQDTSLAAEPKAKLSRRVLRWTLEAIVVQHLTVARVAEGLGVSWNAANDAVLADFACQVVTPGSTIHTDGVATFLRLPGLGYPHHATPSTHRSRKVADIDAVMPGPHLVS